jgi:tetratricopeptide (TPR) repeat protein
MSEEADYLDFEITVRKSGDDYLLRAESGGGQAEVVFTSPFNEDKKALIGATLTKVALRSSAKVRSSSAPEVKKMKEVGAILFQQAITGSVREFYYKCQGQADQQGKGIRWRLSLDPSVGDLPWEFLYLQDEFLALNPRSPVVRYIKGAARVAPLKAEHPMQVLVVIASPHDEVPLDTTAEKDRITAALQPLAKKGLVEVTFIEGPDTWERLIDALLPNRTHILHFIGHGAFDEKQSEGVLIMEDADGMATRIDSERLRVLVQGKSRLRLVVLNSCLGTQGDEAQPFSSMAAGLVRSGIPAVIAMQFEISDHAAQEIAETFYRSLALNMPVDAAVTEARRKIFLSDKDSLEWATPILFMQVPDGRLFQFDLTGPHPPLPLPHALTETSKDTGPLPQPTIDIEPTAILMRSGTREKVFLSLDSITIGRDAKNDIVVTDQNISRAHAKFLRSGNSYEIENMAKSGGTWVNDERITKRKLRHGDVIRLGDVEFRFDLVDGEEPKETTRKRTAGPDESLADKAARRYQEGVAAMDRGEWADAVKAFKGVLYFVPSYRDVTERLAVCESRDKALRLYNQARQLCAEKNYYKALQALDETAELDPELKDDANVRQAAEVGQKYNRALGELQVNNRAKGAELLREVISIQQDFEDAEQRLENLAEGGDGLLGKSVAPRQPIMTQPPPANSGLETRLYELDNRDTNRLAESVRQFFFTKGLTSQVIQQGAVCVVQGKKEDWTSYLGMGQAATVMIEAVGPNLKISVGGGKWLEQGAAMAVGLLLVVPLFTGAVGMAQQKQLMDDLWRAAEHFVAVQGGRRIQ